MIPPQTQKVLDFLGKPASYAHHPAEVTLHQTHASWVFVASPYVYKIKKPVNFGFMDFTTLEKRKANCEREVTLNRRLTEDIYLGVEAISLRDAKLQFCESSDNKGEIVEWAVKMREMDPRDFLSHLAAEHRLEESHIDRLIEKLVTFYQSQPPLDAAHAHAASQQLLKNIQGNFTALRPFTDQCVSTAALDAIAAYCECFEDQNTSLLESRAKDGKFRDCHGDLHLEHIHITPQRINIYDCIEFNSAFREIDIACDIAFLAMDLDFNGEFRLSAYLIDQIAARVNDVELPRLVNYYKCYRACVRGKVEALHSAGDTVGEQERSESIALSRRYLQLALRYALGGSTPTAFIFMGKVGSGKSYLASAFAAETGWLVYSSDTLRKSLAGVPLTERGTAQQRNALYSPEMTRRVYDSLSESAFSELRHGQNVILDATFSSRAERDTLSAKLQHKGFALTWIEASASEETIRERLRARDAALNVISDAREEDLIKLQGLYDAPVELPANHFLAQSTQGSEAEALPSLLSNLVLLPFRPSP